MTRERELLGKIILFVYQTVDNLGELELKCLACGGYSPPTRRYVARKDLRQDTVRHRAGCPVAAAEALLAESEAGV